MVKPLRKSPCGPTTKGSTIKGQRRVLVVQPLRESPCCPTIKLRGPRTKKNPKGKPQKKALLLMAIKRGGGGLRAGPLRKKKFGTFFPKFQN